MACTVLVAIVHFIAACSPPSKNQRVVIPPVENATQGIDTNTSETIEKGISGNTADESEAPIISVVLPVPEPVNSNVLPEPVPDVLSKSVTAKPTGEISARQSQISSVPANFVLIPGGVFQMGSNNGDHDEAPVHPVTVDSFYIGKYEVSQKEYITVMGNNPSSFRGDNLPAENISWYDAVEYCNRLSVKEGLQPAYHGEGDNISCNFLASGYRLPTEAEWEYAAGGVNKSKYAGGNNADAVGWYNVNSNGMTHAVGIKAANSMGLYDMSGNVAEWCWDWYRAYNDESQNSAAGVLVGKTRVVRGGGWGNSEWNLRISARNQHSPVMRNSSVGFRIARSFLEGR